MDNGLPFVIPAKDIHSPLFLWLTGLSIEMIQNRPYQPTDNAKVEPAAVDRLRLRNFRRVILFIV